MDRYRDTCAFYTCGHGGGVYLYVRYWPIASRSSAQRGCPKLRADWNWAALARTDAFDPQLTFPRFLAGIQNIETSVGARHSAAMVMSTLDVSFDAASFNLDAVKRQVQAMIKAREGQ
jgi:hypothetical protein